MSAIANGVAYSTRPPIRILEKAKFSCDDNDIRLTDNKNGTYTATTDIYKVYYIRCECEGFRTRTKPWDAQEGDVDTINFPMR